MPSSAAQLDELQRRYRDLARQILELGLISQGSVVLRHTTCRTPGCRCHADPPQPHGPYWQWTRYDSGKTVTRRLTEPQARLYQEWIANRRRLAGIIAEMEKTGQQVAVILLQEAGDQPAAATSDHHRHLSAGGGPDAAVRVTRPLADALVRTSELLESVAEAAQQWLDVKDDDDRDQLADARAELISALTPPSDLLDLLQRLPGLIRPTTTSRLSKSG
jgi:hypothetical protein